MTSARSIEATQHADRLIDRWQTEYEQTGRAIRVNFRASVPWVPSGERATHLIHPYPAKILRQIPALFAASNRFSQPGQAILDPFAGSGTVLLEAQLAGRSAIGIDINPLAALIATVKTTNLEPAKLQLRLPTILTRASEIPWNAARLPAVVNADYWYTRAAQRSLARVALAIGDVRSPAERRFFLIAFSHCARRVSRASPHFSVPVMHQPQKFPKGHPMHHWKAPGGSFAEVAEEFSRLANLNIERMQELKSFGSLPRSEVIQGDSRAVNELVRASSIDLIITSPPYLGAQKYVRASSLSLGWLGFLDEMTLRDLEKQTVGREHLTAIERTRKLVSGIKAADGIIARVARRNPIRAAIASTYLDDMAAAVTGIAKSMRPGGWLVLVIGRNNLCGEGFATPEYVDEQLIKAGFRPQLHLIDDIRSRALITSRNVTASQIASEEVRVYRWTAPS